MNITMATYSFSGYGLSIKNNLEITRETDKCYFTKTEYKHREFRFLKEEIGKVKHMTRDNCPYLEIAMIDATKEEIKEKLAEWFERKANKIRK